MLTSLTITEGQSVGKFTAVQLLEIQQQALPGVKSPAVGTGIKADPWYLSTPQEWYWAAKNRTEERSWFTVGGRLIHVRPSDNYASDHGLAPASTLPSLSLTPVTTASPRFGDDNGPNYPDIYHQLAKDANLGSAVQSAAVATQIRALLEGAKTMTIVPSPALPVLTAAFFISEVKRNYTAFHTGLMLLDLI